jgi:predicted Fe-Mo cluster-binding NifX family protein
MTGKNEMKIAITALSPDLEAEVDPRFGRAACFIIVEEDYQGWEAFDNPARDATGGAGVQAARFVADKGADVAVSGSFGPNAYEIMVATGIQMFVFHDTGSLKVSEVLSRYREGQLDPVTGPDGPGRHSR